MTCSARRQPTVVMHLMGGLGNQMFQYAFGRRLAKQNAAQLLLDTSGYAASPRPDPKLGVRSLGLAHFRILGTLTEDPYADRGDRVPLRRWIRKARAGWIKRSERRMPYVSRHEIVEPSERHFTFDPRLQDVKVRDWVEVRGFWQSERYFVEIAESIRQELQLKKELRQPSALLAARIRAANAVGIHVRHGDNSNAVAPALGVLSREYYAQAISEMRRGLPSPEFFVFSDDIPWSREVLPSDLPMTFVDHNGPERSHEDLHLMTLCRHHILANSTFGWWGAWLAKQPSQVVIAPRKYYQGDDRPNPDLYPPTWRLLQP